MIIITLPFPPSLNTLYPSKGKRRIKSKEYKAWETEAGYTLNLQKPEKMFGRCYIIHELPSPDNRQRDCDNYIKATTDFLVSRGIIQGDSIKHVKAQVVMWNDTPGRTVTVRLIPVSQGLSLVQKGKPILQLE